MKHYRFASLFENPLFRKIWKAVGFFLFLFFAGSAVIYFGIGPLSDVLYPDLVRQLAGEMGGGALSDRNGEILRLFPDDRGDFRIEEQPGSFPQVLIHAVLAAEDKRFYEHCGYDPLAIFRSAWLNATNARIVSGASTITQQVVRMLSPSPRTLRTKIIEIIKAVRLERQISKEKIMNAYLNMAPMGGNLRGAGIASLLFFGKKIDSLSLSEAALIAAIPQMPSRLRSSSPKALNKLYERRNWVIARMESLGFSQTAEANLARDAQPRFRPGRFPFKAPHFVEWVTAQNGSPKGTFRTSLDVNLQKQFERVLESHASRLERSGAFQAAGMILDTETMEILAMSGSLRYGPTSQGFNNGCTAMRSGGSILKPFLYSMAFEKGFSPASIIPDTRQSYKTPDGDYLPYNADRKTYGPVTIRSALGNSLNIPAVKMLNSIGLSAFSKFLTDLQILRTNPLAAEKFGLGLAIGNPEIRMLDISAAYSIFSHSGFLVTPRYTPGQAIKNGKIISEESAYLILDILSDPSARLLTFGNPRFFKFPWPVALKTGTSTSYRDCWLIAITGKFTVILWAGNFSGAPTYGLSGSSACGPILQNLLAEIQPGEFQNWFPCPKDVAELPVCGISGCRPGQYCGTISKDLFVEETEDLPVCSFHTEPGAEHRLSPEYADWIQQRKNQKISDPFTLAGGIQTTDPLAGMLPFEKPGVRILPATDGQYPPRGGEPGRMNPAIASTSIFSVFDSHEGGSDTLSGKFQGSQSGVKCRGRPCVYPPYPRAETSSAPTENHPGTFQNAYEPFPPGWRRFSGSTASSSRLVVKSRDYDEFPSGGLAIVSPHPGDRLVMVPGGENLLKLRAIPEQPLPEVIWLIDGREFARTPPPYETFWDMTRGSHSIMVVGPCDEASQIDITVE